MIGSSNLALGSLACSTLYRVLTVSTLWRLTTRGESVRPMIFTLAALVTSQLAGSCVGDRGGRRCKEVAFLTFQGAEKGRSFMWILLGVWEETGLDKEDGEGWWFVSLPCRWVVIGGHDGGGGEGGGGPALQLLTTPSKAPIVVNCYKDLVLVAHLCCAPLLCLWSVSRMVTPAGWSPCTQDCQVRNVSDIILPATLMGNIHPSGLL